MTQHQEISLENLSEDIRDIKMALLGNPMLSDKGLVGRVGMIEEKVTDIEGRVETVTTTQSTWKAFASGIAFAVGIAGSLFGWLIATVWAKHS